MVRHYGIFRRETIAVGKHICDGYGASNNLRHPLTHVLTKVCSILEASRQGIYSSHVPPVNILVEISCAFKQAAHIPNFGSIPPGDVSVKIAGLCKHIPHTCDSTDIPRGDASIESTCLKKHGSHVCYFACVPT